MAKDEPAEGGPELPEVATPPARTRGALPLIIGVAVASLALGGGIAWFVAKRGAHVPAAAPAEAEATTAAETVAPVTPAEGPALYLALSPAFVVNLADQDVLRYLQADVEVMARDQKVLDALKAHLPVVRNDLLLLMGQQRYADLETRAGKEKLQAEALAEVQRILQEQSGACCIEALYFTSLVMQ